MFGKAANRYKNNGLAKKAHQYKLVAINYLKKIKVFFSQNTINQLLKNK